MCIRDRGYPEAMLAADDIHKKDPDFKLIYGCEAYFAVSYTHLDVYKRQVQGENVGTLVYEG